MKILVLATNYPRTDGFISLQYIHTRNRWYLKRKIDVSVISFASKTDYLLDGVKVYTLRTYEEKLRLEKFDLIISHAPNIRNHYRFLRKYADNFKNIVFFFHGHEVLRRSKLYPKPYNYIKKSSIASRAITEVYDSFKLIALKKYFVEVLNKSQFVFVSYWMYEMFLKFTKIDSRLIEERKHIIYNSIGEDFEINSYDLKVEKLYDFITIRNSLDGSKYGIDIVARIALENPQYKFCVVGKGEFFRHNKKPENMEWIDKTLSHDEITIFLNRAKCALLPTRTDAQGVMACEMATFGIPLITSNIDVCEEIFNGFTNVGYINNEQKNIDIEKIFVKLTNNTHETKNTKYFSTETIDKEVCLFKNILKS